MELAPIPLACFLTDELLDDDDFMTTYNTLLNVAGNKNRHVAGDLLLNGNPEKFPEILARRASLVFADPDKIDWFGLIELVFFGIALVLKLNDLQKASLAWISYRNVAHLVGQKMVHGKWREFEKWAEKYLVENGLSRIDRSEALYFELE